MKDPLPALPALFTTLPAAGAVIEGELLMPI
jgi:hypothetical protein